MAGVTSAVALLDINVSLFALCSFPPPTSQNSPGRGRGSLPLESAETKTSLYTTSDSNNDAISEYLALMDIADVAEYFDRLDRLIDAATWASATNAAKLLSVNDEHSSLPFLHIEGYGSRKSRSFIDDEAFDQVVCLHLQVIYHIHVSHNYEAAYTTHTHIMQAFVKEILQKKKEVNWFMPIFYQLCSDLRNVAKMADELTEKDDEVENASSYYEQSANYIMEAYRTCTSDVRADPSTTKKIAILNMTNQLFRIYFKINKLNLLKPLIRAIDNSGALYQSFSMADKVTYNYFLGRKAMFDADLPLAEKSLSYAFRNCPADCLSNKRLVLIYLIPVKMFLGHMPTAELLQKYQLEEFHDVVEAVKEGNLAKLDQALEANEHFFIQCGIFLMLEKLRAITFRTLFKRIATIVGGHLIPLKAFYTIIQYLGVTDVDEDELECIVANLIAEKKIKGYISHQHQKLVISKKDPFPPLSSI
ncbi:PCI domain protein [Oesophagostomum dentatum]|uniref:PCI domain-containing protein 2 homolog n=1 Tax=Oesophagostomum dentatum TaxID=61180 RepID=A0A0B1TLM7_OESDE|nr:PCI domain protein [Oesophagostomum dentatum]